jgi:hypothetical protein
VFSSEVLDLGLSLDMLAIMLMEGRDTTYDPLLGGAIFYDYFLMTFSGTELKLVGLLVIVLLCYSLE